MESAAAVKDFRQAPGRLIFDSLIFWTSQFKNLWQNLGGVLL